MADKEEPKLHPVVELMIARMESHPEEFEAANGRWIHIMKGIEVRAIGADKVAFDTAVAKMWMDSYHKKALDELLNGEEHRRNQDAQKLEAARLSLQLAQQYGQYQQGALSSGYGQAQPPYLTGTAAGSYIATADPVDTITSSPNMLAKLKKGLGI